MAAEAVFVVSNDDYASACCCRCLAVVQMDSMFLAHHSKVPTTYDSSSRSDRSMLVIMEKVCRAN